MSKLTHEQMVDKLREVVKDEGSQFAAAQVLDITVAADAQALLAQHGAHPAGEPARPLYWLAEFLRGRGQGLRAGQVVITGTYAGAPWVPVGPMLQVRFGHLGTVTLRFQARARG